MTRRLHQAGLFCITVLVSALASADPQSRIGISVALTGDAATYGTDIRNAIEFANRRLAGGKYSLIVEDDRCQGKDAVTAAQKLTGMDKVHQVLGFACSGALLSSAPVYERTHTIVVASGTSSAAVSNAGRHIFRTVPSDVISTRVLYDYMLPRHQKAGIISEQTEYTQTLVRAFLEHNKSQRMEILSEEYLSGESDLRPILLKLRRAGVSALFLNPQAEKGLLQLVRQVRELQWEPELYAVYYASSPSFLSAAGGLGEGIIFADIPGREALTPEGAKLFADFIAEYGPPRSSDCFFYMAFASFAALHEALKSGENPLEYLERTKFHSLFGDFSFDKNGDIIGLNHVLKRIEKGQAVPVSPAPAPPGMRAVSGGNLDAHRN